MSEPKSASVRMSFGDDSGSMEAAQAYQEAIERLKATLDARKNRMFDPAMLAMASGFLAPTQTGGFGESLGKALGNYGTAQQAQAKEDQELAQQEVALAGQGMQFARQKRQDADFTTYLGGGPKPPVAAPPGALTAAATPPAEPPELGALSAAAGPPGALTAAMPPAKPVIPAPVKQEPPPVKQEPAMEVKPPGFENVLGVQIMPPNPQFLTVKQYVAMNRSSGKTLGELIKEGTELELKAMKENPNGVVNLATGMYYAMPKGETVSTQLFDRKGGVLPGTYDIPSGTAAKLDSYAAKNDPRYYDLVDQIIQGPTRPGVGEPSGGRQSKQQIEQEQAEAKTRAEEVGKAAGKKEAAMAESDKLARQIYGSTSRVLDQLKESAPFYGLFQRPNATAAILGLLDEGIKTQGGSITLGDVQGAVSKVMPNVKQSDLDNVSKSAYELVQNELAFTRLYMSGQGAITEGERKLVAATSGSTRMSPAVLKSRMEMLQARSQYDIDVADAWNEYKDKNPSKSINDFERKSAEYKDLKKNFEVESAKIFGGVPAISTRERKADAAAAAPSKGFTRDPVTGVIRKKREGE